MSKRKKCNGYNPRLAARRRLVLEMQGIIEADMVNEGQLNRLIEGIKAEQSRIVADRQGRDGVFIYHDLAEQELDMFMKIEAGCAAEVRTKIRKNNLDADQLGQKMLADLGNKDLRWTEIKEGFEQNMLSLHEFSAENVLLSSQLTHAQMAVADTFAPRMALVELYYKHTTKHLSEILGRQQNGAVEWGLHSESQPKDIKRFLDEKFSYERVLGLEEDPAVPGTVQVVEGEDAEEATEVFDEMSKDDIVDAEVVAIDPELDELLPAQ